MTAQPIDTGDIAEARADVRAVLDSLLSKRPLDPEIIRRIEDRSERMTEELRKQYGELNVAVDLIREVRVSG
jgi:hypothetical protein